jgi:hypothetical protein
MEFRNLYCLSDTGLPENSGITGKECGADGSESNLEQIFDWKTGRKESIQKACVNMGG